MNYSEMLHDFVDSALPSGEEETLFHALAADEDLRFELKYLLTLRDTVRDDEEAGVVPLASTGALFSRLGYAIPAGVGAIGGAAGSGGLMALLKGWGGYGVAALLGALLTGGIFLATEASADRSPSSFASASASADERSARTTGSARPSNDITDATTTSSTLSSSSLPSSSTPIAATSPAGGARAISAKGTSVVRSTAVTPPRTTPAARADTRADDALRSPESRVTIADQSSLDLIDEVTNADASASRAAVKLQTTPIRISEKWPLEMPRIDSIIGTDLQKPAEPADPRDVKGVQGTPSFTFSVSSTPIELTSPMFATTDAGDDFEWKAGINYPLTSHFVAVGEGGEESYLLTFREQRPDGRVNLYEVTPTVLWGAIYLRWMPLGADAKVSPFIQGGLGGSEAGWMERGILGAEINVTDWLMMSGGLELSNVNYRYQDESYSSPRFGVSYGIRVNPF